MGKVFRNVSTEEIIWVGETVQNQEVLVSHLRKNDSSKWSDVFVWFVENKFELVNESNNKVFLKALMLAVAENVDVTFTAAYGYSPLMLAAMFDDKDSILTLIKRGANVNQQSNSGRTALHIAALYGNIDACATLLDNNANIDAVTRYGETPLMETRFLGKKNMYEFLIEKGADQTRTNNGGKIASQLTRFQSKRK